MTSTTTKKQNGNDREAEYKSIFEKLLAVLLTNDHRPGKTPVEKQKKPSKEQLMFLIRRVRKILLAESTLVEIEPPVVVLGDTHGQFCDLLDIVDTLGWPPKRRYLFLGDYVDRGEQSIELICFLFVLKAQHPKDVFILRGNHESAEINATYGFKQDCIENFDLSLWDAFQQAFQCIPLVGLVGSRILCLHGGLSPSLRNISDIRRIPRPLEIPDEGLACDVLWSDPTPKAKHTQKCCGFTPNKARLTSFYFCQDAVKDFLKRNELDLVVRGHELVDEGFEFTSDKKVVTIFSAPHYCDHPNDAAVLSVDEELCCQIRVFKFKKALHPSKEQGELWNEVTLRDLTS